MSFFVCVNVDLSYYMKIVDVNPRCKMRRNIGWSIKPNVSAAAALPIFCLLALVPPSPNIACTLCKQPGHIGSVCLQGGANAAQADSQPASSGAPFPLEYQPTDTAVIVLLWSFFLHKGGFFRLRVISFFCIMRFVCVLMLTCPITWRLLMSIPSARWEETLAEA